MLNRTIRIKYTNPHGDVNVFTNFKSDVGRCTKKDIDDEYNTAFSTHLKWSFKVYLPL